MGRRGRVPSLRKPEFRGARLDNPDTPSPPMPNPIGPSNGATYDRIAPETESVEETEDGIDIDISELPDEDTVEISGPGPGRQTYGPSEFTDKFRFELQNGMRDPSRRYSPLQNRFRGMAVSGYEERGSVSVQITRTAGSTYSALFNLQYSDASPDGETASTSVEARTEYNRIADQQLELLASL